MKKTMVKYLLLLCFFPLLAVSCRNAEKPDPFLDEDEMCSLLTEIRLAESRLYEHRESDAASYASVMTRRAMDVYVPIFQKYGIDYDQYQTLMKYYMARPAKLKAIYEESAKMLNTMVDERIAADSIAKARS